MKLVRKIFLLIIFIALGVILIKIPWEIITSIIKTWTSPTLKQVGVVGMQMLICLPMFGLVYLFIIKIDKKQFIDFGIFFNKKAIHHIAIGFSLTTACAILTWGVVWILKKPTYIVLVDNYLALGLTVLLSLMAGLFQSFYEELWFRSWALKILADLLNEKIAILFMGFTFGIIHLLNPEYSMTAVISAGLGGILMSSAYFRFRSIWIAVGLHFGWNFTLGGLTYNRYLFKVIFEDNTIANQFTGGDATWEGCLFIAIACLVIWLIPINKENKKINQF